ncbi:hypothetical protein BC829DRAFT_172243 [Chytridium lagenaria]|nr:hypothetical protein BC829DRAFT_172243 [Chytridium lagenaria]
MPDSDDFQSQSTFLINPPKRKKARPPANVRTAKLTKAVLEYQAIVHPLSQGFATQPTQLLHAEEKQDVAVSQAESAKKRCKTNETSLKENLETALHVEEKKHIKKRKLSEKSCKKEDVQLPAELLRVVEIFQCLNTIHSFIASQRENPCTFESLKSGIESLRKEPFQLADWE